VRTVSEVAARRVLDAVRNAVLNGRHPSVLTVGAALGSNRSAYIPRGRVRIRRTHAGRNTADSSSALRVLTALPTVIVAAIAAAVRREITCCTGDRGAIAVA
jgi:hypothetical protein